MRLFLAIILGCGLAVTACAPPTPGDGNLGGGPTGGDAGPSGDGGPGGDGGPSGDTCTTTADCASRVNFQVCDVTTRTCVECLTDSQCPSGETCEHDDTCHGTQACTSDNSCNNASSCVMGGADGGVCMVTPGQCESTQDCITQLLKFCNTSTLQCVQCLTAGDCSSTGAATCSSSNTCEVNPGRCLTNSDCAATPSQPICDVADNDCVECQQNSDCQSEWCEGSTCAPLGSCTSDANCVNVQGKPRCDTGTEDCVECLTAADCTGGKSCNGNQSSGCTPNSQESCSCAGGESGLATCNPEGTGYESCVCSDPCAPNSSCSTCAEQTGCGWCLATNGCKSGSSTGSNDGTCTGTNWQTTCTTMICTPNASTSCSCLGGGTGTEICNPEGTGYGGCSCTTDPCAVNTTCGTCSGASDCGWCATTSKCLTGTTAEESSDGTCVFPNWKYDEADCPSGVSCTPGTQSACDCAPGTTTGVATCNASGNGFGTCTC